MTKSGLDSELKSCRHFRSWEESGRKNGILKDLKSCSSKSGTIKGASVVVGVGT